MEMYCGLDGISMFVTQTQNVLCEFSRSISCANVGAAREGVSVSVSNLL